MRAPICTVRPQRLRHLLPPLSARCLCRANGSWRPCGPALRTATRPRPALARQLLPRASSPSCAAPRCLPRAARVNRSKTWFAHAGQHKKRGTTAGLAGLARTMLRRQRTSLGAHGGRHSAAPSACSPSARYMRPLPPPPVDPSPQAAPAHAAGTDTCRWRPPATAAQRHNALRVSLPLGPWRRPLTSAPPLRTPVHPVALGSYRCFLFYFFLFFRLGIKTLLFANRGCRTTSLFDDWFVGQKWHDRPALCRGQRSHGRSAGAAGPQGRHRGQEQGRQDSIATGH